MDCLIAAEISAKEAADQVAIYGSVITREMYVFYFAEEAFEIISKFFYLGGFSGSVQAFQYYQHVLWV
jgi:hypothetical protein